MNVYRLVCPCLASLGGMNTPPYLDQLRLMPLLASTLTIDACNGPTTKQQRVWTAMTTLWKQVCVNLSLGTSLTTPTLKLFQTTSSTARSNLLQEQLPSTKTTTTRPKLLVFHTHPNGQTDQKRPTCSLQLLKVTLGSMITTQISLLVLSIMINTTISKTKTSSLLTQLA
jgi:hypothetical protein